MNSRISSKPPLLALLGTPRVRDRIQIAFRMGASSRVLGRVAFAADWRELDTLVRQHPGSPALIDTVHECMKRYAGESRGSLADNRSSLPVIWYAPCHEASRRQLSRAGITCEGHLLPSVNDDFDAIDAVVLRSIDAQRVHRLREEAKRTADPAAFEMLDHSLDLATGPCTVPDLAARVGRTRRTLEGRCVGLGIPSPKRLIALARIFTVHRLAEWSDQPFSAVARALGFLDRSAPSMIDRLGGSDYIARDILKRVGR